MSSDIVVPINSNSDIVSARQQGRALANAMAFTSTDATLITTAISELARNIVRYATHGEIILRQIRRGEKVGITVVARDHGPGIANVSQAMQDGFSTSGSLGLGLPGVQRLMDEFEIISGEHIGTTVTIRKWK
ncbi:MAG: ATP-binding protein [Ignavibacteria bacterium 13_1_40CM_2_61_4]|nr:MAG: ATP-binding protein [Ignavibacteria bacterium 13_1_40CM_2_61_4]